MDGQLFRVLLKREVIHLMCKDSYYRFAPEY